MSSYNYFAKVYDRMMDNIPYDEWEQYILQLLYRNHVSPDACMTEIGCGTGIMTGLLKDEGFSMTGIDLSEEMLEVAKTKRDDIEYLHMDMREFHLSEKQDVIISICDSMNYLLTNDDLYRTLKSVRDNLKEGGLLIFDLKTQHFFETELDGETFKEDLKDFSYVWKNKYDKEKCIHYYQLFFKYRSSEGVKHETEVHRQRVFFANDIKEAAQKAGFKKSNVYDEFTFDKPRKNSDRIYIIMRK